MTGIERLRAIAGAWDEWGLGGSLTEIANQIERELQEERDRWDSELCEAQMDKSRVTAVYLEMNKHVLGHEGMEDSPVARWARELREALVGDAEADEDREAAAWVREHGGLESVKERLDWVVGHCSTKQQLDFDFWLSGRVMHELGFDEDMADRDEVERRLLARLMPEGMEWPRYEDGEPVRIWDKVEDIDVRSIVFNEGGILLSDCTSVPGWGTWRSYKERVKRPEPKVPAADGEPLGVGQTVWDTDAEEDTPLTVVEVSSDLVRCEYTWKDGKTYRPCYPPDQLTHAKPEPIDTWQRIEEDAEKDPCSYFGFDGEETCGKCPASGKNCEQTMAQDLVRRAKALAERERGE